MVVRDDDFEVSQSVGGLAAALRAVRGDSVWIGWPGAVVPDPLQREVAKRLAKDNLVPVYLSADEEEDFYGRVCNDTLWPLFHYFGDRLRITPEAWEHYVHVNERFADAILELCGPETRVWVHDFHLMLVPGMLRRRAPDLPVGFFLHTPFPSSEIYRLLPERESLLRGRARLGLRELPDRRLREALPVLVPARARPRLEARRHRRRLAPRRHRRRPDRHRRRRLPRGARGRRDRRLYAQLEQQYEGRRLILGVERLDYTKGIPQKLLAYERFLERDPALARTTTMLQILVPSRLESPEYRAQRDEIELLIARINGRFGQPGVTPVEYLHRDISKPGLVALYRRADVMMVTPLRDGMNLVAHEFVLCQSEPGLPGRWRGSLLLSEFAGSAQVLPGALLVNPWNVDSVVDQLGTALELGPRERRRRLETMAKRVEALDCRRWADGFLTRLARNSRRDRRRRPPPFVDGELGEKLAGRFSRARARTVLLDYDGTLREIEPHPDLALPTPEIRSLLRELAALRATEVHIVSGRRRRNLEQWFGQLPIHLCAEHGYLARAPGEPGGRWWTSISRGCRRSSACSAASRPTSRARSWSASRARSHGTTARRSPSTARGGRTSS